MGDEWYEVEWRRYSDGSWAQATAFGQARWAWIARLWIRLVAPIEWGHRIVRVTPTGREVVDA